MLGLGSSRERTLAHVSNHSPPHGKGPWTVRPFQLQPQMIGSKHGSRVSSSSNVHYDFMIGGPDVDVFGVRKDGSEEPIMVQGDWSESTGA